MRFGEDPFFPVSDTMVILRSNEETERKYHMTGLELEKRDKSADPGEADAAGVTQ